MATYVRLMAFKQRPGWGHETLMREVSDSLHLRRFCLIGSGERAPDESTVVEADVCYRFGGLSARRSTARTSTGWSPSRPLPAFTYRQRHGRPDAGHPASPAAAGHRDRREFRRAGAHVSAGRGSRRGAAGSIL